MLFNSHIFIFVFLPVVWALFHWLRKARTEIYASAWLLAASLFFYAWFDAGFLWILVVSICLNFFSGMLLERSAHPWRNVFFAAAIAGNLLAIGYCKYAYFVADSLHAAFGTEPMLGHIALPLGISFFTFQQIAYMVEIRRGMPAEKNLLRYALCITLFPHLIAGPIIQYKNTILNVRGMIARRSLWTSDLAVGLSIFIVGLAKKVLIADYLALQSTPVFGAAASAEGLRMLPCWEGALLYTFQLYFDFSGYSEMALGLARIFGFDFPVNFNSPYQAVSITDFWRRWHMSLSRFLKEYLYVPLGGNRKGEWRTYFNLLLTMLLGGLWHGANWTFVIWGLFHGTLLALERALGRWRLFTLPRWVRTAATFVLVVVGWVFFRSDSVPQAAGIVCAMFDFSSFSTNDVHPGRLALIGACAALCFFCPNVLSVFARYLADGQIPAELRAAPPRLAWKPGAAWAIILSVLFALSVSQLTRESPFLYFQF